MSGNRYLLDTNAIIAGTAIQYNATLVTADKQLHKIDVLSVWDFTSD